MTYKGMNFHLVYVIIYKREEKVYILVAIIILCLIIVGIISVYSVFRVKINFFVTGMDQGFSLPDLKLLWNVAQICNLEQPNSLFFSPTALSRCMTQIQAENEAEGTASNPKKIKFMTKLFDYRTKIENQSDEKRGIQTTLDLQKGQKLRIILPGKGVFASEIQNTGNLIVISIPKQKGMITVPAEAWVNKPIHVYFWRKGDARYVFDTMVTQSGLFIGSPALFIQHSNNLLRTQKRKSVRAACEIYGDLYLVKNPNVDYTAVETKNGYKCLIEDVSESGALIRIGGKGVENILIKLQFSVKSKLIIMFGVIRKVQFLEEENQSLLHFECTHIDPSMKNDVLSYVYQILPESEKEVFEALSQTDEDNPEEVQLEEEKLDLENKTVEQAAMGRSDENKTFEKLMTAAKDDNAELNLPDLDLQDSSIKEELKKFGKD